MTKRFGVPEARQDMGYSSNAFTLAEVLITLGIIGVVAAMTIPTLISNTNGAQFKTAYKKSLSTLNQAVLMNIAMADTDFSTLVADSKAGTTEGTTVAGDGGAGTMAELLRDRLQSANKVTYPAGTVLSLGKDADNNVKSVELSYEYKCTTAGCTESDKPANFTKSDDGAFGTVKVTMDTDIANYIAYSFADGTAFMYYKDAKECTDKNALANKCYGFIDVNGATTPNKIITCDSGTGTASKPCTVDSSAVTDLYPVVFHGQTVEPATDAARVVLMGK